MNVKKAKYKNYRNLQSVTVEFSPGVNVLWGMNAQGKSNVLEGLYYFARGRSFRGAKDRDLVAFGEAAAICEIEYEKDSSPVPVKLSASIPVTGKKKLYRNGAPLKGSAEMLGNFRAALFCPSHLSLVGGGPAERRAFLDIAIAQNSHAYIYYLSNYRRFLAERNALLKRHAAGKSVTREEWETYAEQLSIAAAEIYAERNAYCDALTRDVADYFREMTGGVETPALIYTSQMDAFTGECDTTAEAKSDTREGLFEKLTSSIDREAAAGSTLWGPHKDDIHISINGKEARLFASQGQQRSIALSMKLAEGEISKRLTGEYPVFLLDDVFSELDERRRAFIMDSLKGRQIIVTSCEPSVVPGAGAGDISYFRVSEGRVEARENG